MIPRAHVTAWRAVAPWPADAQVEQDLVLSRALVELFRDPFIAEHLAFRGGTALHKLFLPQPGRYSEDLDLVQTKAGPIGNALGAIRRVLDPWLGEARHKRGPDGTTLVYRFESSSVPVQSMRLKIEINTREQFAVFGRHEKTLRVRNPWFDGTASIATFRVEELLGTKMRALFQRKKGRDLFDLWLAMRSLDVSDADVVASFSEYMRREGQRISRARFEANLHEKLKSPGFGGDISALLATGLAYDFLEAHGVVQDRLVSKLPGAPWRRLRR